MSRQHVGLLFWNVQSKDESIPILAELVRQYEIDVIALAESPKSSTQLALEISSRTQMAFRSDIVASSSRITWAFRKTVSCTPVFDGDKVSIREVVPPLGQSLIVSAVHASSRMSRDVAELNVLMPRAAGAIGQAELRRGHDRSIVFGDFNLSPFDEGLISSESFHATMSKNVARRGSRVVYGEQRKFFYNPMWKLIAEDENVCGTYHYSSNNPLEYFWHCYDQMLIRPSILNIFPDDGVKIIKKCDAISLVDEKGIPCISDHLPIVAKTVLDVR